MIVSMNRSFRIIIFFIQSQHFMHVNPSGPSIQVTPCWSSAHNLENNILGHDRFRLLFSLSVNSFLHRRLYFLLRRSLERVDCNF